MIAFHITPMRHRVMVHVISLQGVVLRGEMTAAEAVEIGRAFIDAAAEANRPTAPNLDALIAQVGGAA